MNKEFVLKILKKIGHSESDAQSIYDYFKGKGDLMTLENLIKEQMTLRGWHN